jgi:hypothetical protein
MRQRRVRGKQEKRSKDWARHHLPPVAAIPANLAALRAKFPDLLKLKGLSTLDAARLSREARAADKWFKPALDLLVDLQRRPASW